MEFKFLHALSVAFVACQTAAANEAVINNYANIGAAKYEDSLISAQALQSAVNDLISDPSAEALQATNFVKLFPRVNSDAHFS